MPDTSTLIFRNFTFTTGWIAVVYFLTGCYSESSPRKCTGDFFTADFRIANLEDQDHFDGPFVAGEPENAEINEASGLAVSRANPGHVWTHNDKGDRNRIFLIGPNGEDAGTFRIENSMNRDWEDMAIGPGPDEGTDYLYIADIGDNDARYDVKRIYRIPEPSLEDHNLSGGVVRLNGTETIQFRYPDGPRDAETLMIDPLTKDLYIVTKREEPVTVYVARYPQQTVQVITLEKLGTLPITDAVAGDISADGSSIVIKTKAAIYFWTRDTESGETISEALQRIPEKLPYIREPQGEAFAWSPDGNQYYTLSEKSKGVDPVLYHYIRVISDK